MAAMNATPKIVISQTLPQTGWAGTQIISHHFAGQGFASACP
jgi:hypothetical protein